MSTEQASAGKRILILTADVGFGHRSAAEAVKVALDRIAAERGDDEIVAQIANPLDDKRVPALLRDQQTEYDSLVRTAPDLYKLGYEVANTAPIDAALEGALILMLFEVIRDVLREHRPDVIVSTYPLYQAPIGAVRQVTDRRSPLLTVVTDLATVHGVWFQRATDLCLVPTDKVAQIARKHGMPESRIRVTGLPVDPRLAERPADRAALRRELGWEPDLTTLLVVGSKRVTNLLEVLRALNHARLPIQLVLVAGGDDELYDRFQAQTWHLPAQIYNFVEEMPRFLIASDVIMSKAGGLIVSESLAAGLPMVLVNVLPGQEVGNAEHVVEGGAGVIAKDPISALETLWQWLDEDGKELRQRARAAEELGKPRAAEDVAQLALEAASGAVAKRRWAQEHAGRARLLAFLRRNGLLSDKPEGDEAAG